MRAEDTNGQQKSVSLNLDGIPDELKQQVRWVGWRYANRAGKPTKTPVACRSGRTANVTEPKDWATFDDALASSLDKRLDGLGFVFSQDDPYVGIDLDNSRDPGTGRMYPWGCQIVRDLDSYTEVSPSGTGVHVIVKGEKPPGSRSRQGNVEVYSHGRYFTVTGNRLVETPETVEARQGALGAVLGRLARTDEDIIRLASEAANGDKFRRLWAGDDSGYISPSEADQALCGILAYWTFADPQQMERLFNRSVLGRRQKWQRREGYRKTTIERALAGQIAEVFTRGTRKRQDNTEKSGRKHIAVPAVDLEEDRQGKAVQMAIELASAEGKASDWIASFKLARRLRTLSEDDPEQFEPAIEAFAEKADREFEPLWYAFLGCWESVRYPEGEGQMVWAARRADEQPYPLAYYPGRKCEQYKKLASMAFHLSKLTSPKPFWLTRELVAKHIGCRHPAQVTRIIDLLLSHNVIKCVNNSYSFSGPNPRAKEYEFIGGPHND